MASTPAPVNLGRTVGRAVGPRDEHHGQDLHIAAGGDLLLWTDARVEFGDHAAGGVQRPNVLTHLSPNGAPAASSSSRSASTTSPCASPSDRGLRRDSALGHREGGT
jgi:hypothetical protein